MPIEFKPNEGQAFHSSRSENPRDPNHALLLPNLAALSVLIALSVFAGLSCQSIGLHPDAPQIKVGENTDTILLLSTSINLRSESEARVELEKINSPFVSPFSLSLRHREDEAQARLHWAFNGPEDSRRRIKVTTTFEDKSGKALMTFTSAERDTRPLEARETGFVSGGVKHYRFPWSDSRHKIPLETANKIERALVKFEEIP